LNHVAVDECRFQNAIASNGRGSGAAFVFPVDPFAIQEFPQIHFRGQEAVSTTRKRFDQAVSSDGCIVIVVSVGLNPSLSLSLYGSDMLCVVFVNSIVLVVWFSCCKLSVFKIRP
jgi:hypothetical protein